MATLNVKPKVDFNPTSGRFLWNGTDLLKTLNSDAIYSNSNRTTRNW